MIFQHIMDICVFALLNGLWCYSSLIHQLCLHLTKYRLGPWIILYQHCDPFSLRFKVIKRCKTEKRETDGEQTTEVTGKDSTQRGHSWVPSLNFKVQIIAEECWLGPLVTCDCFRKSALCG